MKDLTLALGNLAGLWVGPGGAFGQNSPVARRVYLLCCRLARPGLSDRGRPGGALGGSRDGCLIGYLRCNFTYTGSSNTIERKSASFAFSSFHSDQPQVLLQSQAYPWRSGLGRSFEPVGVG